MMSMSRVARSVGRVARQSPLAASLASTSTRALATLPPPKFFDFDTVKSNLSVKQAFGAVEQAFAMLSENKVKVECLDLLHSELEWTFCEHQC
jgi:hypothetical protein